MARDEVQDNTVMREWAKDNGVTVNKRGKLPEGVITAYRRSIAQQHPKVAREWARTHGYRVPRTSDLSEDVLDAFANYRAPR